LFTANHAYLRDFKLCVPQDAVASNTEAENLAALDVMARILKADTTPATDLDIPRLARRSEEAPEFGARD